MKKKILTIAAIVIAAALFIGSIVLYNDLSKDYKPNNQLNPLPPGTDTKDTDDTPDESEDTADSTDESEDTSERELQPAPDFAALDYDGNEVKLSDYFGKPMVLNFWASWCPPCKQEMPDFQEVFEERDDVQFLMVNATTQRETVESAKAHIESNGFTFSVLFDTTGEASYKYSVYSLPTTFFINSRGEVVVYATGMISKDILLQGIELILASE